MPMDISFSAWSMELLKHLKETNDERQHDAEFINTRTDMAAAAYEDARLHQGMDPNQAMEVAHSVLMSGLHEEENDTEG